MPFFHVKVLDNLSVNESVVTVEHLLERIPCTTINQRQNSLSAKDDTITDNALNQLESAILLPTYDNEMKQLETNDNINIVSNEDSNESCASSQIFSSCIIADSYHVEVIPVISQFPHTSLVNDVGCIADPNGTSKIDTDYIAKEEYDLDYSFKKVLQIDIEDFSDHDVHNTPQTISISSKECASDDNGYIHSLSTKVSTIAVEDDNYIN